MLYGLFFSLASLVAGELLGFVHGGGRIDEIFDSDEEGKVDEAEKWGCRCR